MHNEDLPICVINADLKLGASGSKTVVPKNEFNLFDYNLLKKQGKYSLIIIKGALIEGKGISNSFLCGVNEKLNIYSFATIIYAEVNTPEGTSTLGVRFKIIIDDKNVTIIRTS